MSDGLPGDGSSVRSAKRPLMERLRAFTPPDRCVDEARDDAITVQEAADRIEQLERELAVALDAAARSDAIAAERLAKLSSTGASKAWLIEFTAGPTLWFAGTFRKEGHRYLADFVQDANAAVRYPSRAAAEWAFDVLLGMRPRSILGADCYKITEHEWVPATVPTTAARADYQASSPCPKGNTKELDGRCFGCDCGLPTHEDCCRFVAHMFGETHPAARDRILELIAENAARRATPSTQRAIDDATVLNAARWLWLRERYDSWTHRIFTVPPGQQRDEAVDAAMRDTASAREDMGK